jgi:hypothetical protein
VVFADHDFVERDHAQGAVRETACLFRFRETATLEAGHGRKIPPPRRIPLLVRHPDLQAVLGRDQVVVA